MSRWPGGVAQVIEHLLSKYKTLSSKYHHHQKTKLPRSSITSLKFSIAKRSLKSYVIKCTVVPQMRFWK
jgi:hypothetical protein